MDRGQRWSGSEYQYIEIKKIVVNLNTPKMETVKSLEK